MPMFWGDYLRDTGHLSAGEHGAYLLLIGHYWTTGAPLPDDDASLRRISRMEAREWSRSRATIRAFFDVREGMWRHKRVDTELARAKGIYDKRVAAANRRWGNEGRARDTEFAGPHADANADAHAYAGHEQPEPEPEPYSALSGSDPSARDHDSPPAPAARGPSPLAPDTSEIAEAVSAWNALADDVGLAKVQRVTDARAKALRLRLRECGGIEGWNGALAKIRGSPFLLGQNDRGWRADLDFLCKPSSFVKIMEGTYDGTRGRGRPAENSLVGKLAEVVRRHGG